MEIQRKANGNIIPWWLVLLEGLASLIIGIYLIASPIATTIILVRLLGWYWLFLGITTIATIFMDKTNWIWRAISGMLGILAGLAVIGHPFLSALLVPEIFVIIVGVLVVCFGFIRLFCALKEGWGAAIMGAVNILLGALILGNPLLGIISLVYIAAILGIAGGIAAIYMAIKMRK